MFETSYSLPSPCDECATCYGNICTAHQERCGKWEEWAITTHDEWRERKRAELLSIFLIPTMKAIDDCPS